MFVRRFISDSDIEKSRYKRGMPSKQRKTLMRKATENLCDRIPKSNEVIKVVVENVQTSEYGRGNRGMIGW